MSGTRIPSLGPNGEGWVALQILLGGLVLAAGVLARGTWDGGLAVATAIAGGALIVGGGALAARGLRDLGRGLTPLPRPRDGAELVAHGAYRLVRHPIYGGICLASMGWALLLASGPALVAALVLLGFFDLKARREEVWLVERYVGYRDYASRTRRLIPGIW